MRKILALLLMFCPLFGLNAEAQSLKETVQQIKKLRNISFNEIVKFKFSFQENFSVDTLNSQTSIDFSEPQIGGYYKIKGNKDVYLFDGNKVIWLNLRDTTYNMTKEANRNQFTRSLLYWRKQVELYLKSPSKIKQLKDTVIDKSAYNHFMVTLQDTIQKNEHVHSLVNIVTDKKTHLPFIVKSDFKGFSDDGAIIGAIEQHTFKNYKENEKNFPDLSNAIVPEGFKLPSKKVKPLPLAIGTTAPQINLHNTTGKVFDMTTLGGKIILLNFTLLGCPHCINSAQMLTRLNEKFKNADFEIISIYQLRNDDQEAISKFDSKFNIKYPSYTTENEAESIYHFQGYPHFFLIDKQGKILQGYEGFYANLEEEITTKINSIK